jgi:hypothetical protein
MTSPSPSPRVLIQADAPQATVAADGTPEPAAPGQQDLFSEPGESAAPAADSHPKIPAGPATDLGTATAPAVAIPKGFRPAGDPPKVGRRVLAILADGTPEFVTFEKIPAPSPEILFSYGYRARQTAVAVKCWRPIPSNWTE